MNTQLYDRGVNTFSPEGRLYQVEYASESIKLGTTVIGISCRDGIVMVAENRVISPLVVGKSLNKVFEIDKEIGLSVSGLIGDGHLIIKYAREVSQMHRFKYNESINPIMLIQYISDLFMRFGESGSDDSDEKRIISRPFGVSMLLSGFHNNVFSMFYLDPSGSFLKYKYKAIGVSSEIAENFLKDKWNENLSIDEAKDLAINTLKCVMEDKENINNIQISITDKDGFRTVSQ
eukprot:GHVP01053421.1.p1 GENE.GHVP01053421.1~~GHVP01053421.1.p1  ORF type:complete len:233 (+),score=30.05 GHVP01053421.1:414-1112(+)